MEHKTKRVFIMRGLPGSGKSTLAAYLAPGGVVHCTDNHFVDENGVYKFEPEKLKTYHAENFAAFVRSLQKGISPVIFDAINALHKHYQHYIDAAERFGYTVAIVSIPHSDPETLAQRNTHAVPLGYIRKTLEMWEP